MKILFIFIVVLIASASMALLILQDPTLKAYGFIGEVGTGEALGAELIVNGDFRR